MGDSSFGKQAKGEEEEDKLSVGSQFPEPSQNGLLKMYMAMWLLDLTREVLVATQ